MKCVVRRAPSKPSHICLFTIFRCVVQETDALKEQNDTILRETARENLAEREVTIMGDKGTPFSVLKRVMATATASDYGKVSLAVLQREKEAGA